MTVPSVWTHAICATCWWHRFDLPQYRAQVTEATAEVCCFCGGRAIDGIYVRMNPVEVPNCRGQHRRAVLP